MGKGSGVAGKRRGGAKGSKGKSKASAALPNYDASLIGASAPAASAQRLQRALRSLRNRGGYRSEIDAQLGTPSFLWAPLGSAPVAVGPLKATALPESRARALLYRQASLLGLSRDNIDAAELIDISDRGTGPSRLQLEAWRILRNLQSVGFEKTRHFASFSSSGVRVDFRSTPIVEPHL